MSEFKREIRFLAAWDKRDVGGKNYGVHGVEMKWFLRGPKGTIQFVVYTHWMLPHVQKEQDKRGLSSHRCHADVIADGRDIIKSADANFAVTVAEEPEFLHLLCHPMPADIGYHSPKPQYEGQSLMSEDCEYVEGGKCYYDGSGLAAETVFNTLVEQGDEAAWKMLEDRYRRTFDGEKPTGESA